MSFVTNRVTPSSSQKDMSMRKLGPRMDLDRRPIPAMGAWQRQSPTAKRCYVVGWEKALMEA